MDHFLHTKNDAYRLAAIRDKVKPSSLVCGHRLCTVLHYTSLSPFVSVFNIIVFSFLPFSLELHNCRSSSPTQLDRSDLVASNSRGRLDLERLCASHSPHINLE